MSKSELYSTSKGRSLQCDLSNSIYIEFREYTWKFSITDFLVFRKNLHSVNVKELLFNLSDECDFVSLQHAKLSSSVTLTLCDLIQLRELVDGTKFSLELVSMIHEVLGDYEVV
ncbi:hypothetical protein [Leadbetterella byssophila]|uniref:hypothetical protein n=1 Tax=Leadbetterella byssophila TaxID=316068 RepID=UPI0039A095C5